MLALAPDRAPITPILKLQSSPDASPPPPSVSVVPHALSTRPAAAAMAATCHVLDERIMDPSVVLWAVGLTTSAASWREPNTLTVARDTIGAYQARAVAVS